jgi:hypothetical protein
MMFLKTRGPVEFIESMIICFASPVATGIKCGALLNLRRSGEDLGRVWFAIKDRIREKLGLEFAEISYSESCILLLIFRSDLLMDRVSSAEARKFLGDLGYNCESGSAASYIENLIKRFKTGFPHEIGIFLGYPIEDVKGFIENRGRNSKLSGYWKVYGDEANAKKKFDEYRKAETDSAEMILKRVGFTPAAERPAAFVTNLKSGHWAGTI